MFNRLSYWRRIFKVYFTKEKGYLSFWHETPAVSEGIDPSKLGPYYMTFADKANYTGPKDNSGVILFDYYFDIGRQYNPLAVAQYGLGNYNLFLKNRDKENLEIAKIQADWLVDNLEENEYGFFVWKHKFKWHYKQYLKPGWYSAHSQGTGISLLLRVYGELNDEKYLKAAQKAFASLNIEMQKGGVKFVDKEGGIWLEEYLIDQPTHILNGYLWALWGVWDYYIFTKDSDAKKLFGECIETLKKNLPKYDFKLWSLYDLSEQFMPMVASHFYHKLHIVQLKITFILSKDPVFDFYAKKFQGYNDSFIKRNISLLYKAVFKIFYF